MCHRATLLLEDGCNNGRLQETVFSGISNMVNYQFDKIKNIRGNCFCLRSELLNMPVCIEGACQKTKICESSYTGFIHKLRQNDMYMY